jgi:ferredoxin--NADP+ reductase
MEGTAPIQQQRPAATAAATSMNARVTAKREVAPGLMILRIEPEGWELPDFEPGQFAVLGLSPDAPRCAFSEPESAPPPAGKLVRRAYSIASSSVAKEFLEFYVALVRSGAFTPRLFALEVGDPVWLSPKVTGMFTLAEVPEDSNLVLIATGTGLAPYMSMIRTRTLRDEGRRVSVIHGAKHSWDLGYRSELLALCRAHPGFRYLPTITEPLEEPTPWTGLVGYVQDLWLRGALVDALGSRPAPANTHVFLCGNPAMIADMTAILTGEGFREHSRRTPGEIHTEKYW